MAKKIQEDWDTATDGRETFLYDGRGRSTSPHASPPKGRFGPTTRVMAKRIQEGVLIHVQNALNSSVK